jgi:hypothetical protein
MGMSQTPESQVGRRARDRIGRRARIRNRTLVGKHELRNLLLFVDDDLRETAVALGGIESFLVNAQELIEREDVTGEELRRLASDLGIDGQLDYLGETLASLRRRMNQIADKL